MTTETTLTTIEEQEAEQRQLDEMILEEEAEKAMETKPVVKKTVKIKSPWVAVRATKSGNPSKLKKDTHRFTSRKIAKEFAKEQSGSWWISDERKADVLPVKVTFGAEVTPDEAPVVKTTKKTPKTSTGVKPDERELVEVIMRVGGLKSKSGPQAITITAEVKLLGREECYSMAFATFSPGDHCKVTFRLNPGSRNARVIRECVPASKKEIKTAYQQAMAAALN